MLSKVKENTWIWENSKKVQKAVGMLFVFVFAPPRPPLTNVPPPIEPPHSPHTNTQIHHPKDSKHQHLQIDYLQEQVKNHHQALNEYKNQIAMLQQDKENLSKLNAELEVRVEEFVRSNELLKDKMRLYSGDSGIDTADLERALTLVKRRSEVPAELNFLNRDDADNIETVPALRAKTQNLQIKILEQVRELERSERMLQAQSSINRDINTELESLQKRFNGESSTLHQRCNDLEILSSKRLQRIKVLEAQLKQYIAR